jgi:hypothetical protein
MNGEWLHDDLMEIREAIRIVDSKVNQVREEMAALKVKTGVMGSLAGLVAGLLPAMAVWRLK